MHRTTAYLVLLIAMVLCPGCNPDGTTSAPNSTTPNAAGTGATESKGTIGVSLMTLTNPFFVVIGDTITAEASKHGYEVIVLGADENAAKQADQVRDFIVKGVSAIVLAPFDSQAIGSVIAEADAAGIPVFTIDNGCLAPDCKVKSHVATDNFLGGQQAAEAMIEAIGDTGGNIAILDHKVTESCKLRVDGFKEVLKKHNEAAENRIKIVTELPCGGNREAGFQSTKDILQSDGDIVGLFAINDPAALGAYSALAEDGKADQVAIIGFDGMPDGKKAIRDGKIYADPIQHPKQMSEKMVEIIMLHFDGQEVESEFLIETTLYRKADGEADKELD